MSEIPEVGSMWRNKAKKYRVLVLKILPPIKIRGQFADGVIIFSDGVDRALSISEFRRAFEHWGTKGVTE